MDIHASDPVLLAGQQLDQAPPSADIMELCKVFLLNLYLRHFGHVRLFEMLQREHERHQLATNRAFALLIVCFATTWLLQTDLLHWLLNRFHL